MKKLSYLAFILLAVGFLFSTTGCDDETPEPPVTTTDTTDNNDPAIVNKMTVGFDRYELNIDETLTDGFYSTGDNSTVVNVSGNDGKEGDADFTLTFPGNTTGTFTTHNNGGATFEAGTGTVGTVQRTEMDASSSDFTIVVTEYGAVGEKIKGTFSGKVKNTNSQSIDIKDGEFEVTRKADR